MREAMDNFDSLLSSPSWSDMNESTSWSWVGNSCIPNGVDLLTEFNGNSFNHQSCHSFSKFQQMAQNNDIDCNVAAKPRVRAPRGQATDPHSIAERLRREKIAERMKNLKELVPNSIKTDKASMLDEIIDYVKFLQLRVKVLSMSRLGTAGAVVPLITDVQAEDTGSLNVSSISQVVDMLDSEENLAFEQEVVKLMESNVTNAMQYLQNKGLCLMPIALATVISNQKLSYAAEDMNGRNALTAVFETKTAFLCHRAS